jgi:hypothetical protein
MKASSYSSRYLSDVADKSVSGIIYSVDAGTAIRSWFGLGCMGHFCGEISERAIGVGLHFFPTNHLFGFGLALLHEFVDNMGVEPG